LAQPDVDVCFVVMPFGAPFDERYHSVFAPAIVDAGLSPVRADSLFRPAPIVEDIWRLVRRAVAIVADLTGANPNVFYELGLAHAARKAAVLLADKIESVPFDLRATRVLVYRTEEADWEAKLRKSLTAALSEVVSDPDSAVPSIVLEPPRGFDIRYSLQGRRVTDAHLDDVRKQFEEVLGSRISDDRLAELLTPRIPDPVRRDVRKALAKLGTNFPDTLLAEMIAAVHCGHDSTPVTLLVETGFARDFVEANLIYELVGWACHNTQA
jgi:hypothetical protein